MFPNETMMQPADLEAICSSQRWSRVRDAHGWSGTNSRPMAKKTAQYRRSIGYGFMGRTHSQCVSPGGALFRSGVSAGSEGRCARAIRCVEAFAATGATSRRNRLAELVERDDIDLIDIATPNNTHAEIAIAAARAGKMIMCEKPLGRTREAEAMVVGGRKGGVPNMVWYNYRRVPAVTLSSS